MSTSTPSSLHGGTVIGDSGMSISRYDPLALSTSMLFPFSIPGVSADIPLAPQPSRETEWKGPFNVQVLSQPISTLVEPVLSTSQYTTSDMQPYLPVIDEDTTIGVSFGTLRSLQMVSGSVACVASTPTPNGTFVSLIPIQQADVLTQPQLYQPSSAAGTRTMSAPPRTLHGSSSSHSSSLSSSSQASLPSPQGPSPSHTLAFADATLYLSPALFRRIFPCLTDTRTETLQLFLRPTAPVARTLMHARTALTITTSSSSSSEISSTTTQSSQAPSALSQELPDLPSVPCYRGYTVAPAANITIYTPDSNGRNGLPSSIHWREHEDADLITGISRNPSVLKKGNFSGFGADDIDDATISSAIEAYFQVPRLITPSQPILLPLTSRANAQTSSSAQSLASSLFLRPPSALHTHPATSSSVSSTAPATASLAAAAAAAPSPSPSPSLSRLALMLSKKQPHTTSLTSTSSSSASTSPFSHLLPSSTFTLASSPSSYSASSPACLTITITPLLPSSAMSIPAPTAPCYIHTQRTTFTLARASAPRAPLPSPVPLAPALSLLPSALWGTSPTPLLSQAPLTAAAAAAMWPWADHHYLMHPFTNALLAALASGRALPSVDMPGPQPSHAAAHAHTPVSVKPPAPLFLLSGIRGSGKMSFSRIIASLSSVPLHILDCTQALPLLHNAASNQNSSSAFQTPSSAIGKWLSPVDNGLLLLRNVDALLDTLAPATVYELVAQVYSHASVQTRPCVVLATVQDAEQLLQHDLSLTFGFHMQLLPPQAHDRENIVRKTFSEALVQASLPLCAVLRERILDNTQGVRGSTSGKSVISQYSGSRGIHKGKTPEVSGIALVEAVEQVLGTNSTENSGNALPPEKPSFSSTETFGKIDFLPKSFSESDFSEAIRTICGKSAGAPPRDIACAATHTLLCGLTKRSMESDQEKEKQLREEMQRKEKERAACHIHSSMASVSHSVDGLHGDVDGADARVAPAKEVNEATGKAANAEEAAANTNANANAEASVGTNMSANADVERSAAVALPSTSSSPSGPSIHSGHSEPPPTLSFSLARSHVEAAVAALQARMAVGGSAASVPDVRWADVGGLEDAKRELQQLVPMAKAPATHSAAHKHPHRRAKTQTRSGLLLFGPPGTGKTLLAKAVATECGMNFMSVKGPELLSMYIGESEKNVRAVFKRAREAAPCVLFFDEVDSLAPARGSSGAGVLDRVVSQLLTEIDACKGVGVYLIAATNRPDLLDASLLRPGRIDRCVYLGTPSDDLSQANILRALTRKLPLAPSVDIEEIVSHCPDGVTGADMSALTADAALEAARKAVERLQSEWTAWSRERARKRELILRLYEPHARAPPSLPSPSSSHSARLGSPADSAVSPALVPTAAEEAFLRSITVANYREEVDALEPVSLAEYVREHASEASVRVTLQQEDFLRAAKMLVPSLSKEQLEHYQVLRKQFAQVQ